MFMHFGMEHALLLSITGGVCSGGDELQGGRGVLTLDGIMYNLDAGNASHQGEFDFPKQGEVASYPQQ